MMEVVVQLKSKEQRWRLGLTYEALVEEMDQACACRG